MNKLTVLSWACAWLVAAPGAGAAAPDPAFQWPHGARAAVSLAYDDALNSQLDNALPALDKYGVKGSFYLQLSSPVVSGRMAHWRAAAHNGHELGNHTLFHQCSRAGPERAWVEPHRDLDKISVAQVADQAVMANTMLYAIDGKRERTFTAPCLDLKAGGEYYLPAIAAHFVAIKAAGGDGVVPSMATLDPHHVPVMGPVNLTGKQLIEVVKRAGERGTMANFTFHGIGGDHLAVSSEAHEELVAFLAVNRALYWTDTFLNIMKHVTTQKRAAALAHRHSP